MLSSDEFNHRHRVSRRENLPLNMSTCESDILGFLLFFENATVVDIHVGTWGTFGSLEGKFSEGYANSSR